jgi:hypothetical protein
VFRHIYASAGQWFGLLGTAPPINNSGQTQIAIMTSRLAAGDLCAGWGPRTDAVHTGFCTAGSTVALNTWYFLAVSAEAHGSGYPTIRMYLGNAGTIAEFGGVNMAIAPSGTTGNGLTKYCYSGSCGIAPAVAPSALWLGALNYGYALNGTMGEAGLYSGVVPGHVIREIYRTLRADWARVGRGAI